MRALKESDMGMTWDDIEASIADMERQGLYRLAAEAREHFGERPDNDLMPAGEIKPSI